MERSCGVFLLRHIVMRFVCRALCLLRIQASDARFQCPKRQTLELGNLNAAHQPIRQAQLCSIVTYFIMGWKDKNFLIKLELLQANSGVSRVQTSASLLAASP
ncbi:hypothetical protein GOODEAATRI_005548, partial [Goodea atripinnis]